MAEIKKSFLLPTDGFKSRDMSGCQIFMKSLICGMDANCEKLLAFDTETVSNGEGITGVGLAVGRVKYPREL